MNRSIDFLHSHLFLYDVNNVVDELGSICLEKPSLIFRGYKCNHYYHNFSSAEIVANTVDENGEKKILDMSCNVTGNYIIFAKIVSNFDIVSTEGERCVLCNNLNGDLEYPVPLRLINGDVLPSYRKNTTILGQAIGYVLDIELESSLDGLLSNFDILKETSDKKDGSGFGIAMAGDDLFCHAWGKVEGCGIAPVDYNMEFDGQSFEHAGIPYFIMNTPFGYIKMILPMHLRMDEEFGAKLLSGECHARVMFNLCIDVAMGEYNNGAIFDEAHLLRVFMDSEEFGDTSRLEKNLADDLVCKGIQTTYGKNEYLDRFHDLYDMRIESGSKFHYELIRVTEVSEHSGIEPGKLGVLIVDHAARSIMGYAFIYLDSECRINEIRYIYDHDLFKYEVIYASDIPCFNISAERLASAEKKSEEELLTILYKYLNGETEDMTDFLGNLADDSEFDDNGRSFSGRFNAYYFFMSAMNKLRKASDQVLRTEHAVTVIKDSFGHMFTINLNTDGKIENVRRGFLYIEKK